MPDQHPAASLSMEDLAVFNDEIAAMARAGLPLDQGLSHLATEMGRGNLQRVTAALADDLKAGKTLPDAFAQLGNRLPPFYVSLVTAGLRTGRLADVLATMTTYARSMSELRTTVVNSLIYPAIIVAMGFALFVFWLFYIGPQFQQIFETFKLRMPGATRFMMHMVDHRVAWSVAPWVVLAVVFAIVKFGLARTEAGRRRLALFIYAVPLIGTLLRSARLAAFVDLLGILVDYRVPLADAYRLAAASSSDPLLSSSADAVLKNLDAGKTLGASLRDQRLVPDFLAWMIGMGERNQKLPDILRQTGQFYRKQSEMRANLLRHVLPAFTIAIIAFAVLAFVAVGVFLPMLGMLEGLSGGGQ